ncbi:ABC transporter permease [Iodobacter sp. CM08]|uniref:ABC transporter permease n=1 Tax=Iodobacter sp. CM08 TaxID=3085902 RepID=UPI002981669B|nr:ABC transporter permease [Iodobacter sp. CM08]MDW5416862.1 ABC transporter permease [Iodobacter sp. CM08]
MTQLEINPTDHTIQLSGRLDAQTVAPLWAPASKLGVCEVDASKVSYCDGAGVALFYLLIQGGAKIKQLAPPFAELLDAFQVETPLYQAPIPAKIGWLTALGKATAEHKTALRHAISYLGELSAAMHQVLLSPSKLRITEVIATASKNGADALPIVALIAALLGMILAFQSAIPMRQFGAEVFVADLVGLSLVRELAPLMMAILLAGRTGAAFAAELASMKVNEELNALTTLGLNPIRYLVLPRIIATTLMAPLLSACAVLIGLVGAAIVMLSFNIPIQTYISRVSTIVHLGDFTGGLFKAAIFGMEIALIGCFRGLQAGSGASAVGAATTQAVVSSIVAVVVSDGLFAFVFYLLGW